jgi:predicted membrane-bound mannosyltransferase
MNKAVFSVAVAGAIVLGLAIRLASLDLRPMHHDEANQAEIGRAHV